MLYNCVYNDTLSDVQNGLVFGGSPAGKANIYQGEKPWVSCGFSHQFWGLNWVQKSITGMLTQTSAQAGETYLWWAPDDGQQWKTASMLQLNPKFLEVWQ